MPVKTTQFQVVPVQKETIGREPRLAKTDAGVVLIDELITFEELHAHVVEPGTLNVPQIDRTQICQRQIVMLPLANKFLALTGDDATTVA